MNYYLPQAYRTVLEIGCGQTLFSSNLTLPCEIWGIEPDKTAAVAASSRIDRVLNGTYDEVYTHIPNHYFDLVICNDVIEHMPDHDAFFESIKLKLTRKAYLVASIPNVRYCRNLYGLLVKKDWEYEDSGILDKTHLRFFTGKSFAKTLRAHGFNIECAKGINSSFTKPTNTRKFLLDIFLLLAMLVSFGSYADIQYPQFAFRASYQASFSNNTPCQN